MIMNNKNTAKTHFISGHPPTNCTFPYSGLEYLPISTVFGEAVIRITKEQGSTITGALRDSAKSGTARP